MNTVYTTSSKISPKSFINKHLYENIPEFPKKRYKVSPDNFEIPTFEQYDTIRTKNYNVKQLKTMCKFYNQKRTGNKNQLMKQMFNFLKFSLYAVKIQTLYRRHLVRRYINLHGPAMYDRSKCVNDTDFLTLEELTNVPHYQFFSYKDKDNFIYGFDIKSLYNLFLNNHNNRNNKVLTNPYNRGVFPKYTKKQLRTAIRLARILGYPVEIDIENETQHMNIHQKQKMFINQVFQKIDELGNYTDTNWFHSLNKPLLIRYIRELFDIWNYRAQLTYETKRSICPPTGQPFSNNAHFSNIRNKTEFQLKDITIQLINKLVSSGVDESNRNLGAMYCLAALTLVNHDAAQALPWLYQSVMHN